MRLLVLSERLLLGEIDSLRSLPQMMNYVMIRVLGNVYARVFKGAYSNKVCLISYLLAFDTRHSIHLHGDR